MSPIISSKAGDSAQGYGFFASLGAAGFIGYLSSTGSKQCRGIRIDSSDNVYIGATATAYPAKTLSAKLAAQGASITWQRQLGDGVDGMGSYGILVDNSGNVYWLGSTNASGNTLGIFLKYNSSGTLQFQRKTSVTSDAGYTQGAFDSAQNNIYMSGGNNTGGAGSIGMCITKWTTAGAITWQKKLQKASDNAQSDSICLDSSDNVYMVGYTFNSPSKFEIAKYNSSGTLQWQREISNAGQNYGKGIATDSTNVYAVGFSDTKPFTAKYNTSGTLQWSRLLTDPAGTAEGSDVAIDASGNAYIVGTCNSTNSSFIAKYNSSGTLQWQRKISTSATINLYRIVIKGDALYCVGTVAGQPFYLGLPTDGSKLGTWTVGSYSVTIAAHNMTDAASGYTDAAGSMTDQTPTTTSATPTYTDAAASQTNNIKVI